MESLRCFAAAEASDDGDPGNFVKKWFLPFFAAAAPHCDDPGSSVESDLSFFVVAAPDNDDPGSSAESNLSFFAVAAPDDDDPGSSVEKLTADSAARVLIAVFTR